MDRYIIFVSDLHLSSNIFKVSKLFLEFLDKIAPHADALYILGDFFDFWIGDDDRSTFNKEIKTALKKTSSKIPIYLMSGNRDFLLGETFAQESGCNLLSDPYIIDLYGKKTLLTHGDLLCSTNNRYRIFRNIIRIPYGIKIFLKLPLKIRFWFANIIKKYYSHKVAKAESQKILPAVQLEAVKNLLGKFNSEQIIHGHFHIAEVENLSMETNQARRLSLGAWDKQGNILIYYSNGDFEFKSIF